MKYILLGTKFTTIITTLNSADSRSSITKSILIVFYRKLDTSSKYNSLRGR